MKRKEVLSWSWLEWDETQRAWFDSYYELDVETCIRLLNGATLWYASHLNPNRIIARKMSTDWPIELRRIVMEMPLNLYATIQNRCHFETMQFVSELSRIILKSAKVIAGEWPESVSELEEIAT